MNVVIIGRTVAVLSTVLCVSLATTVTRAQTPKASESFATNLRVAPARLQPQALDYRIGADDVLDVFYWQDKDLSAQVTVRPDGNISLPLLRDVEALGLTPEVLADRIQVLASAYLEDPRVTVMVKQINSRKAFITGEVVRAGSYSLSGPTTVLQLIAMAGGLTTFANQERIRIVRSGVDGPVTLTFNYKKALQGKDPSGSPARGVLRHSEKPRNTVSEAPRTDLNDNVLLLPGDTIIVP